MIKIIIKQLDYLCYDCACRPNKLGICGISQASTVTCTRLGSPDQAQRPGPPVYYSFSRSLRASFLLSFVSSNKKIYRYRLLVTYLYTRDIIQSSFFFLSYRGYQIYRGQRIPLLCATRQGTYSSKNSSKFKSYTRHQKQKQEQSVYSKLFSTRVYLSSSYKQCLFKYTQQRVYLSIYNELFRNRKYIIRPTLIRYQKSLDSTSTTTSFLIFRDRRLSRQKPQVIGNE